MSVEVKEHRDKLEELSAHKDKVVKIIDKLEADGSGIEIVNKEF